MSAADIIVIAVLTALVVLIAAGLIRRRKKGGSCSCGCDGCSRSCGKRDAGTR